MNTHVVIMAGGIGSRLWPLSTPEVPKQFIDVLGVGRTLLQLTKERFSGICPPENVWVLTNRRYADIVKEQLPDVPEGNILLEPCRRNTAPCIAYANYRILSRTLDASIVVTPADHLVTNEVEFQRIIRVGMDFVEAPAHRDALLTIGIKPSRPETGYGYIEVNNPSAATAKCEVLPVVNFKEKPDLETAKQYLAAGRYLWNAGIFVWSLQGIRNAYHAYLPDMEQIFDQGRDLFGTEKEQAFIDGMFAQCENISIDYGVMERSPNRYTIPADFGWSDIGTWGSLYEHAAHDSAENAVSGHAVLEDTRCSVVNIEKGYEAVVQGMDHCLVALRDHSLLVCRLDDEQNIKHWIERL